ncbi:MAG: UDP-N-acetylmuramate dehydrogenase [Candidatus Moranbacteria bacterium]|nr:UDP-N-acetylmuramate dehydrogenase [Candidatus Moranbacteria bacterium]
MIKLRENVPLAPLTTFGVGGAARYYSEVSGAIELAEVFEYAEKNKLPLCILGGGSNILFSDKGFAGLVAHVVGTTVSVVGEQLSASAGVSLLAVVTAAKDAELQGLEKLAGIPGSFGGAIRGNAGAFGVEISQCVVSVKALDRDTGMVREYHQAQCEFHYRSSLFKLHPQLVILSADLKLVPGKKEALARVMEETIAAREAKHPQAAKCAGSFFMNPTVTDTHLLGEFEKDNGIKARDGKLPAGWLIDYVGLRGKKIGGAMVSDRHPNYLVNTGHATALDIVTLASLVKTRVRDELHIKLTEEVQYVGF